MEELINQAFMHVEGLNKQVAAGQYELLGPNNEIILPQIWESIVEPDWTITMMMWAPPAPPPMQHHPSNGHHQGHGNNHGHAPRESRREAEYDRWGRKKPSSSGKRSKSANSSVIVVPAAPPPPPNHRRSSSRRSRQPSRHRSPSRHPPAPPPAPAPSPAAAVILENMEMPVPPGAQMPMYMPMAPPPPPAVPMSAPAPVVHEAAHGHSSNISVVRDKERKKSGNSLTSSQTQGVGGLAAWIVGSTGQRGRKR